MSRRKRIAWALGFLALVHGAVLLAGFVAPYPYAEQHRDFPYAAPMGLHLVDQAGRFHWWPGVRNGDHWYPLRLLPGNGRLFGVDPPGVLFLLGTDGFGRDVFSRVLYGGRVSLFTGLLAAIVSLMLGLAVGVTAGYFGGWLDGILMRGGELVMALPWFYLLLGVRAVMPLHISTGQAFVLLTVMIGGLGWVRPARLIRGVVLSGRERGFVAAARGFGAGSWYIIRRHLLWLTSGVLVTQATVLIPQYFLAEVTLSFLGLGVAEPVPSWGNMLTEARQYHALVSHPWLLAPGLAVIPVLLASLVLADALLEARGP